MINFQAHQEIRHEVEEVVNESMADMNYSNYNFRETLVKALDEGIERKSLERVMINNTGM